MCPANADSSAPRSVNAATARSACGAWSPLFPRMRRAFPSSRTSAIGGLPAVPSRVTTLLATRPFAATINMTSANTLSLS